MFSLTFGALSCPWVVLHSWWQGDLGQWFPGGQRWCLPAVLARSPARVPTRSDLTVFGVFSADYDFWGCLQCFGHQKRCLSSLSAVWCDFAQLEVVLMAFCMIWLIWYCWCLGNSVFSIFVVHLPLSRTGLLILGQFGSFCEIFLVFGCRGVKRTEVRGLGLGNFRPI